MSRHFGPALDRGAGIAPPRWDGETLVQMIYQRALFWQGQIQQIFESFFCKYIKLLHYNFDLHENI